MKGASTNVFLFYASIGLAIFSSLLYHVFVKLIPAEANPALVLLLVYLVAGLLCLGLFFLFPLKTGLREALSQLNWAGVALAFAIVGLELGFLLAYRAGWRVSTASTVVMAAAATLLVPVGMQFFKEDVSPTNLAGVLLCVVGLVLVNVR